MKNRKVVLAVIGLVSLMSSALSAQPAHGSKKVAVFPLEGVNVSHEVTAASTELLSSSLMDAGFRVQDWRRVYKGELPGPGMAFDDATKSRLAEELDCDGYVDGKMVSLGSKIRVTVRLKSVEGEILDGRSMEGKTEDDLAIVFDRMAVSLFEGKDIGETLTLDNATRAETNKLPQRYNLEKNFGLMIGETFSLDTDTMPHYTTIAFDGRLEVDDILVIINAGLGIVGGHDVRASFFADVGFGYYLTHSNLAPYLGAGVGIFVGNRVASTNEDVYGDDGDDVSVGFEAFPALGIEFLRKTRMRLHMEARYIFSIVPDSEVGHGPGVFVGINF